MKRGRLNLIEKVPIQSHILLGFVKNEALGFTVRTER
jgi:hypothetical protein